MSLQHALRQPLWIVLVCGATALACQSNEGRITDSHIERARSTLDPLKKELVQTLTSAIEDGPEAAIRVCRVEAPAIAAKLEQDGIEIGRTSHRLRNPANAPAPWLESLVNAYLETPDQLEPRAVPLPGERFGYVEPIYAGELCLRCHGSAISGDIETLLTELYPEDQATGFAAGDFRGLFWVTMPMDEPES